TLTYNWDFGDGTTNTGVTVTHSYSGDGGYVVTFTVRDAQFSDTATVTVTVYTQGGEFHWLEAEYPDTLTAPMQVADNPLASGERFIYVPNGGGGGGDALYTVTIATGGEYVIWGRVYAANQGDNSFHVQRWIPGRRTPSLPHMASSGNGTW
ncbi:hypothetical protein LCGC14_1675730, partial [marine sediment metagenome]